jgi:hypothetical protein
VFIPNGPDDEDDWRRYPTESLWHIVQLLPVGAEAALYLACGYYPVYPTPSRGPVLELVGFRWSIGALWLPLAVSSLVAGLLGYGVRTGWFQLGVWLAALSVGGIHAKHVGSLLAAVPNDEGILGGSASEFRSGGVGVWVALVSRVDERIMRVCACATGNWPLCA